MPISDRSIPRIPPNAKCVAGVWLTKDEELSVKQLTAPTRKLWKRRTVDGKGSIGYRWVRMATKLTRGRRVAIDVGANVGLWSMHLVRWFSYVHAFEPVPHVAAILPWNMPSDNYTLHNYALGERLADITMTVPLEATAYSHITTPESRVLAEIGDRYDEVPAIMRTLDSFEIKDVDLLKIDVEGYELQVLRGAEQTIRSCRPLIVIEQNGHEERYGVARDSALALLVSWGAREVYRLKGDYFMGWE